MKASTDRILTTHTCALHRPSDLEELYRKKFAGEPYDEAAIDARLTTAVAENEQTDPSGPLLVWSGCAVNAPTAKIPGSAPGSSTGPGALPPAATIATLLASASATAF